MPGPRKIYVLLPWLLLAGAPAAASPYESWSRRRGADLDRLVAPLSGAWGGSGLRDVEDETTSTRKLPWLRIELVTRLGPPIDGHVKKGREDVTHKATHVKDARMREVPSWGYAARFDVKVFSWCSIGGDYYAMHETGPRDRIHHRGITIGDRFFPGGSKVRGELTVEMAEISLRYIWREDERVHLWFGIGPAWASYRLTLQSRAPRQRATAHVRTVFAPSLTYMVAARVTDTVSFYYMNGIAVSPIRFPSFFNEFRLGFRFRVGGGLEVVFGFVMRNGLISDTRELWGHSPTGGHNWKRARWTTVGLELGLGFTN